MWFLISFLGGNMLSGTVSGSILDGDEYMYVLKLRCLDSLSVCLMYSHLFFFFELNYSMYYLVIYLLCWMLYYLEDNMYASAFVISFT